MFYSFNNLLGQTRHLSIQAGLHDRTAFQMFVLQCAVTHLIICLVLLSQCWMFV